MHPSLNFQKGVETSEKIATENFITNLV